eukprot:gene23472-1452_t
MAAWVAATAAVLLTLILPATSQSCIGTIIGNPSADDRRHNKSRLAVGLAPVGLGVGDRSLLNQVVYIDFMIPSFAHFSDRSCTGVQA